MKAVIKEKLGDEYAKLADEDTQHPDFCPVFLVATEGQDATGPAKLFRSYGFYRDKCPIWQACRATVAAPSFFKPMFIDQPPPGGWYLDGGLKRNNPSKVALQEAGEYWQTIRRFCIISIGTGIQKEADFIGELGLEEEADDEEPADIEASNSETMSSWIISKASELKNTAGTAIGNVWNTIGLTASKLPGSETATRIARIPGGLKTLKAFAEELVKLSTESEETHREMLRLANSKDPYDRFPYHRFNVQRGLQGISLEEWRKRSKLAALTRGYLSDPSIEKAMEMCLDDLVHPGPVERT